MEKANTVTAVRQVAYSVNGIYDSVLPENIDRSAPQEVKCDGETGCGRMFSVEEPGSDPKFARLCCDCYLKSASSSYGAADVSVAVCAVSPTPADTPAVGQLQDTAPALRPSAPIAEPIITEVEGPDAAGGDGHSDFEGTEEDIGLGDLGNSAGMEVGAILLSVLDMEFPEETGRTYDVFINGEQLVYEEYRNPQDVVTGNQKRFFSLRPNPTPLLFGWEHFHAFVNRHNKRGWMGHCLLKRDLINDSSSISPEELAYLSHCLVLVEIWYTRCNKPRIDFVVCDLTEAKIRIIQNGPSYMTKHRLSCDMNGTFCKDMVME